VIGWRAAGSSQRLAWTADRIPALMATTLPVKRSAEDEAARTAAQHSIGVWSYHVWNGRAIANFKAGLNAGSPVAYC
jgi:hypothetical protein